MNTNTGEIYNFASLEETKRALESRGELVELPTNITPERIKYLQGLPRTERRAALKGLPRIQRAELKAALFNVEN